MLSVKAAAQNVLKYVHLYERAKVSRLYDLYWRIADRRIIYRREREIEFYRHLLRGFRKGDLIFDIGANNGLKTEIFFRLGATVIAVDPDEANQRALTDKFRKFRSAKKRVLIVGKAISDKNGFATFWIDRPGSNMNTLNEKWVETLRIGENRFGRRIGFDCSLAVETITLESLIQQYGFPFFVKIDVEGHEVKVLKGLRRPVPFLSFEVNLPEFRTEGFECIQLLEKLAPNGRFNYLISNCPELANEWLTAQEFRDVLRLCATESIEVLWKT